MSTGVVRFPLYDTLSNERAPLPQGPAAVGLVVRLWELSSAPAAGEGTGVNPDVAGDAAEGPEDHQSNAVQTGPQRAALQSCARISALYSASTAS